MSGMGSQAVARNKAHGNTSWLSRTLFPPCKALAPTLQPQRPPTATAPRNQQPCSHSDSLTPPPPSPPLHRNSLLSDARHVHVGLRRQDLQLALGVQAGAPPQRHQAGDGLAHVLAPVKQVVPKHTGHAWGVARWLMCGLTTQGQCRTTAHQRAKRVAATTSGPPCSHPCDPALLAGYPATRACVMPGPAPPFCPPAGPSRRQPCGSPGCVRM